MRRPDRQDNPRRGTVLIVAMWIVLVLAGLVMVFGTDVQVDLAASENHVAAVQADAIARGALQFVLAQLEGTEGRYEPDETVSFEAVPVGRGWFWVLNPVLDDDRQVGFGIRDESSRINLNSAEIDMLLALPGMTSELAASIIDWRDTDDEVTPGGAESETYLLLADPYTCKNGPFERVEEVLLVKGMTETVLYGEDANLNGVLDTNEDDADDTNPPDNRDGRLDRGMLDYLTVYTREPAEAPDGTERLDVNNVGSRELSELVREHVSEDRYFQVMDRIRRNRPYDNVLDFYVKVQLKPEEFKPMVDRLSAGRPDAAAGLVNVNTAPREVLLCLPGLEEKDVDAMIAHRQTDGADTETVAWLIDVLSPEKLTAVGGAVTTRSYQYSADIVAVSGDGRAFRRYRAVIDTRTSPARVLVWKDLTHLGWPLSASLLQDIRQGKPREQWHTTTGGEV